MPIVHSHASISGHYTDSGCCSLLPSNGTNPIAAFSSDRHTCSCTHARTHTHTQIISEVMFTKKQV